MKISRKHKMNTLKKPQKIMRRFKTLRNKLMRRKLNLNCMYSIEIEKPMANWHANKDFMIRSNLSLKRKSVFLTDN